MRRSSRIMSLPVTISWLLNRGIMKKMTLCVGLFAACMTLAPAMAEKMVGVMVHKAQIKLGIGDRPAAMHGVIMNHGADDSALIGAQSPAFSRIELHTHETDATGMMRMMQVESYPLPANGMVDLKPGGDHLMLFGFTGEAGKAAMVTLIFTNGERQTVSVPTKARDRHKGHMGHHGRH